MTEWTSCIEIHEFLEGCGSRNLGDWRVRIDWGGQNPLQKGVQPRSIEVIEQLKDLRK